MHQVQKGAKVELERFPCQIPPQLGLMSTTRPYVNCRALVKRYILFSLLCLRGLNLTNLLSILMGLRWRICQSARLSSLLTWVQFPLGTTYDSYVKRVSQRSAESRGFSPGTPVSSHRKC